VNGSTKTESPKCVRVAWSRLHIAVEPTAPAAGAYRVSGKASARRTGLILSGGNANLETVATLLSH